MRNNSTAFLKCLHEHQLVPLSITQSILPHEAVLLKLHMDFAQGWALIQVNFDPIQESRGWVLFREWVLFHETTVIVTP